MYQSIWLEGDVPHLGDGLAFNREAGYILQTFDIGRPEDRPVVLMRSLHDGSDDYTAHFGPRAVTIGLGLEGSEVGGYSGRTSRELAEVLRAWMRPSLRFVLAWEHDDGAKRRMEVRGVPIGDPVHNFTKNDFSYAIAQFRCPSGVIEEYELRSVTLSASAGGSVLGRAYPRSFDVDYPDATPPVTGTQTIDNPGLISSEWVARIYGSCTNPVLTNVTTGLSLAFVGLVIAAGDYIEVDSRDRTVRLNSLSSESRYSYLDFANSTWWTIEPGVNELLFSPSAFTAAQAVFEYRPAYL